MRKDKSALFVSKRFGLGTCVLHKLAGGRGARTKQLCVFVTARNTDGDKARGHVCADHAAEVLAVSNAAPSLY